MPSTSKPLVAGFLASSEQHGDRPALEVAGETLSYRVLRKWAESLAAAITRLDPARDPPLVAVLGERSATVYAGVLGSLLSGRGYVPLSPRLPIPRTRAALNQSGCLVLIVDHAAQQLLPELLAEPASPRIILLPDSSDVAALRNQLPGHRFLTSADREPNVDPSTSGGWPLFPVEPDALAYVMFTSGSTGAPKGVMVTQHNVRHFLEYVVARYGLSPRDRLSQTFDLVFDLSVFDLFAAWEVGACVCVPSRVELLAPAAYIHRAELTVWFSVPSLGLHMKRLRQLESASYPGLRLSLFCGEALTADLAQAWSTAAPNSILENLYGPTELTLCCTYYRWSGETSESESWQGVVPIGAPFPGAEVLIANDELYAVGDGEPGELLVSGPQVAAGYYGDPDRTSAAFVVPPGKRETYYRTGDRVRRGSKEGPLLYLGRLDQQLKIRGHRIELGEIEAALRAATGVDTVAAIGWPLNPAGADGVVGFVVGTRTDPLQLRVRLSKRLPDYAVPRDVRYLAELPLNSNGKVDRQALQRMCAQPVTDDLRS